MRKSKNVQLSVTNLESKNLMSGILPHQPIHKAPALHSPVQKTHAPVHHAPAHAVVHASAVKSPHEYVKYNGTGNIFMGAFRGTSVVDGDTTLATAICSNFKFLDQNNLVVVNLGEATVYTSVQGNNLTFSIKTSDGFIFGKGVNVAYMGFTGYHYMTTGGTGSFADYNANGVVTGTGYIGINDGNVSFNPHESQA